jgi:DNA-binding response OmpR family regulator
MRIAVIDDDAEMLGATCRVLQQAGHEVSAFSDSAKGLKEVRSGEFDVLVTDMLMPGIDGVEVIRNLRNTRPKLWIVAISGGGELLPAATALKFSEVFGADRVLYKPFRKAELLAAVARD